MANLTASFHGTKMEQASQFITEINSRNFTFPAFSRKDPNTAVSHGRYVIALSALSVIDTIYKRARVTIH